MWSFTHAGQYQDCGLELNATLENGFQDFWQGQGPGHLRLDDNRKVDFQLLLLVSTDGGQEIVQPLVRQEPSEASNASGSETTVEWGHGHEYVPRGGEEENVRSRSSSSLGSGKFDVGLVAYSPQINALLEESYSKFRQGTELKGVLFTSTNGADYLVEFPSMMQLRLQTRRSRLVYRHRVGTGLRGHAGTPQDALAKPWSSQYISAVPRPLAVASCQQREASGGGCSDRNEDVQSQAVANSILSRLFSMMPCINEDWLCSKWPIKR